MAGLPKIEGSQHIYHVSIPSSQKKAKESNKLSKVLNEKMQEASDNFKKGLEEKKPEHHYSTKQVGSSIGGELMMAMVIQR